MTKGVHPREARPTYCKIGVRTATLDVDTEFYALRAIQRAAYKFTDRCAAFLAPSGGTAVTVTLGTKTSDEDLDALVCSFCNELLDKQIREDLAASAGQLRALIVAQAFADANLVSIEDADAPSGAEDT